MSCSECNTLPTSKEFIRDGRDAYYCVGGDMVDCLSCKCCRKNAMQQLVNLVDSSYTGNRMSYLEFIYSVQSSIVGLPKYALCGKENLFDENTMSIEDYCEIEEFSKYDTLKKHMLQYKYNKGIPLESLADVLAVNSNVLCDSVYFPAIRGYCEKSNIASNVKAYRGYVAFCFKGGSM